jgi:hypothetical protein
MMQRNDLAFVMSMDLERPASSQKKFEVSIRRKSWMASRKVTGDGHYHFFGTALRTDAKLLGTYI